MANSSFGINFQHPIFQTWGKISPQMREKIYVKENQVYAEYSVRGDWIGYATQEISNLSKSFKPSVWALELAYESGNWCYVLAPKDFDIRSFHNDLSLLFYLGTMAKLVNRGNFLEEWELPASLLSPGISWGDSQGWWHKDQGVMVVCLARENSLDLKNYLFQSFSINKGETVEIRDSKLKDTGLLGAMELLHQNIQQNPRK
jgi:hypothetical protein